MERIIEVKVNGYWTYTKTVKAEDANKIVRQLNKEGHTARSRAKVDDLTKKPRYDKPAKPKAFGMLSDAPKKPKIKATAKPTIVKFDQIIGPNRAKLSEKQLHAMLIIMDDKTPSANKPKIHKATIKALAARDLIEHYSDGVSILTAHGRMVVLGSVAKVITPQSKAERVLEIA